MQVREALSPAPLQMSSQGWQSTGCRVGSEPENGEQSPSSQTKAEGICLCVIGTLLSTLIYLKARKVGAAISPTLQTRKLRLREGQPNAIHLESRSTKA